MTSRDFSYWLQGYFELLLAGDSANMALTVAQVDCIRRHLAMVFAHEIDPSQGPQEHQEKLNDIHEAPKLPGGTAGMSGKTLVYRC